jgi:filamentous hemagglutinin family protein
MKFHTQITTLLLWLWMITMTHAEVVLDGTLGPQGALPGPQFLIDSSFGQQVGPNLFHSFETFNLNPTETAIFMDSIGIDIDNVISRVTGGRASFINGVFRSVIPGADVYFLNPAGVMFGQKAKINVPGSLYISTADYLRLGEEGIFYTEPSQPPLLTVAPPSAFGFLEAPNGITIENSLLSFPNAEIVQQAFTGNDIPSTATLSFVGGNILIKDGQILTGGNNVHLVSVASQGEVPVNATTLTDDNFSEYGTLNIVDTGAFPKNNFGNVDASGFGGGTIFIRVGQLFLDNAWIFADTWQNKAGRGITVQVDNALTMQNGSLITTHSLSPAKPDVIILGITGNAGNIAITTSNLSLNNGSQINSTSQTAGAAGNLTLLAQQTLSIIGSDSTGQFRSGMLSNTLGTGNGGEVSITTESLIMDEGANISAKTQYGLGQAGNLSINVRTLSLLNGAQIDVSTGNLQQRVPQAQDTGNAGQLTIKAQESVQISGSSGQEGGSSGLISNVFTQGQGGTIEITSPNVTIENGGSIQAATITEGHAGNITLNVDTLRLSNGGRIQTNTFGSGRGGEVNIIANEGIVIEGATTGMGVGVGEGAAGLGGNLKIQTGYLQLMDTTINGGISASSFGSGNAGNIFLVLADTLLMQNSFIRTATETADGGNIQMTSPRYFYLIDSEISTSVGSGLGGGGNITIGPKFIIQDNSPIIAEAYGGPGGNIDITTTGIYLFPGGNSRISASSQFGVDGVVQIETPDESVDEGVLTLTSNFLDASALMNTPCSQRLAENLSSFIVVESYGVPTSEDDLLPSGPLLSTLPTVNTSSAMKTRQLSFNPLETWLSQRCDL